MTSAIITGAYGFIGSHLVAELANRGVKVYFVGRYDSLYAITDKVDMIYHCADVTPNLPRDADDYMAGMKLVHTILHYWKNQQPQATLVGFNSVWAYPAIDWKTDWMLNEDSYWLGPMRSWQEYYGIQKKALCVGMNAFANQYEMASSFLTLGNVYGPGDTSNRFVNQTIAYMKESPDQIEMINRDEKKNFIYVKDQINLILRASKSFERPLNIAGRTYTKGEVVDELVKLLDYKGEVCWRDDSRKRTNALDCTRAANMSLFQGLQVHTLEEGLRKTLGME
jgi:nucleoside-diphosphate-sugar epimerase